MIEKILSQIENINKSIAWVKKNKPADYNQKFLQLVEERRKLYMLKAAVLDNPAIAAYGVSQVGKSYLINCILQKNRTPFMLHHNDKKYNFIEEMNPKTKNTEATGVVTRFSSFAKNPERYSDEYPILMKCLSVSDVIMVLCDGYYNDVFDYTTDSEEEIKKIGEEKYNYYITKPINTHPVVTADNVLDIKDYFVKHINNAQAFLHTSFFDIIALIADRIPETDLVDVFSVLWNKSSFQTKLFVKMFGTLSKLHFSEYVYLSVDSLLHNGINENTVMSVQCLNELFISSPKYYTNVYLKNGKTFEEVSKVSKSEICAVCSEIIVKVGEEYQENINCYNLTNIMQDNVRNALSAGRSIVKNENGDDVIEVKTDMIKHNDLLDFPGARSRRKEKLEALESDKTLIAVLLRGKVAYLFNIYNDSRRINVLLYCHHGEKNEVNDIPLLLNDWILNYVGKTMEKRKETLISTGGISPFFYIGTKFNIDMKKEPEPIANNVNALNERWNARFNKVLYLECFNADGSTDAEKVQLFLNWTKKDECFSNSYILRDYKFSGPGESQLYENERTSCKKMMIEEDYYNNLRETFCQSEHVKRFFSFPELSWDVAASIDNDGALYIIEQMTKVASCMSVTRDKQFSEIISEVSKKVFDTISGYYQSTDTDKILENNLRKAKAIFREMDFTCNSDNYFFGHLLQALQVTETEAYRVVHKVMQSPDIINSVNDFKDYEIIRNSCKKAGWDIEDAKKEEEKWQCLIETYGLESVDAVRDYLVSKKVDSKLLFSGEYKRKTNSCIIADSVYDKWCSRLKSVDFINEFTSENGFDVSIMTNLIEGVINASNAVKLKDIMADSIAEFVNVLAIHTANESLLADLLAGKISDFVEDFGYSNLTEKAKEQAKNLCIERKIPAFNYIEKGLPEISGEEAMAVLFNEMASNPKALLSSFEDNYNRWIEYMFISFIANLEVGDFNREANSILEQILDRIKNN